MKSDPGICFTQQPPIFPFGFVKVNSLPNNKFLDRSNLKAFADDKVNVNEKLKFGLGSVKNIMGKGEKEKMLVISIFSLTNDVSDSLKVEIVLNKRTPNPQQA